MSEPDDNQSDRGNGKEQQGRSANGRKQSLSPARLARRASDELAELLGREAEGIVSLQRSDDGWCVGVEVLEIARVPNTADVLAEYEVRTDRRGRLMEYRRVRRYARGSTREQR